MRNVESTGHDDVFPDFLNNVHEKVITLLRRFFNKTKSGVVPNDWALSIKKETKKDPNNYARYFPYQLSVKAFHFSYHLKY